MADPQVQTTLRRKREEIETVLAAYEAKIEDAKRDLSQDSTDYDGSPALRYVIVTCPQMRWTIDAWPYAHAVMSRGNRKGAARGNCATPLSEAARESRLLSFSLDVRERWRRLKSARLPEICAV
jgi:hypothetical protein